MNNEKPRHKEIKKIKKKRKKQELKKQKLELKKKKSELKKKKKLNKKKVVKKAPEIKKEKKKINLKKVLIFILLAYLIVTAGISFLNFKIKNIVISNNKILSDQEIIDIAKISNYPSFFRTMSSTIENRLEKNELIKDVKVKKSFNGEIRIEVIENYPLFLNSSTSTIVLLDGRETKKTLIAPVLMNYVPDNVYPLFIKKMQALNPDVLSRTSEIQYTPNEVDDSRFMFYMVDGNYVYLTLSKFDSINDYVNIMENIIAKFGNKNGILNLDAGGYFDLIE